MKLHLKNVHLLHACLLLMPFVPLEAQKYLFSHKWGGNGTANGKTAYPSGIAINSSGNICVSEAGNNRIEIFSPTGTYISKWGNTGSGDGQFVSPGRIAMDASDNTYVCDQTNNNRIQKINSSGTYVTQWGGTGSGPGQFDFLSGVAVDASNNVYVVDYFNARIQKFDASGTLLTSWGSPGSGDGQFAGLQGITVSASGNIYVTEYDNSRVQKFDASGAFLAKWGSYGTGNGEFDGPAGIALDTDENVYVVDYGNNRIQKFNSNGAFITQWGRFGTADGQFNGPSDIVVDASGKVYVTDTYNHRVQVFYEESSTTWNGSSWSNGTPSISIPAKIEGNYSGASFECSSLIIAEGISLVINTDKYVTAEVVNTLGSGKIILKDGGSLNYTTYISGNINIQKTAGAMRYNMLAPIKSKTGGSNLPSTSYNFYYYDETARTATDFTSGWKSGLDGDNSSTAYALYNVSSYSVNGILPYQSLPVSIPVTKTAISSDDTKNGWNLIGNISTCPLSVGRFLAIGNNPSNINGGAIYVWDGSNYVAMNTGRIASYQGFFVKVNSNTNLEISSNMFSIANVSLLREAQDGQSIILNIDGLGKKDQTQIDFKDGESDLYSNKNDALKFMPETSPLSLGTKIQGSNQLFAINTMGLPTPSNNAIPLVYSTQTQGLYNISLGENILEPNTEVVLLDKYNSKETVLNNAAYSFSSAIGEFSNRFTIQLRNSTVTSTLDVGAQSSLSYAYTQDKIIFFNNITSGESISVFDVFGNLIYKGNDTKFKVATPGLYIVTFGNRSQKVLVD